MDDSTLTKEQLAGLLREAEGAHGEYERQLGHRDDDWPDWYAAFIVSKLQEPDAAQLASTSERSGRGQRQPAASNEEPPA